MAKQKKGKLNYLAHHLPEGLLVDAAWLGKKGYSTSLRSQYVAGGWLKQPARQVYWRPRGPLRWQEAVVSLQTLLGYPLTVGGRTALELQGYAHYLAHQTFADLGALDSAIHQAVDALNHERMALPLANSRISA